jgi:hypothetical protein
VWLPEVDYLILRKPRKVDVKPLLALPNSTSTSSSSSSSAAATATASLASTPNALHQLPVAVDMPPYLVKKSIERSFMHKAHMFFDCRFLLRSDRCPPFQQEIFFIDGFSNEVCNADSDE